MSDILMETLLSIGCAVITAVSVFLIKLIASKVLQTKALTESTTERKYIDEIGKTVSDCVAATSQTIVDDLKKAGNFDKETQQKILNDCCEKIVSLLSSEAIDYINEVASDGREYLITKIEAAVKAQKR